jgi:ankyrin repeat protein
LHAALYQKEIIDTARVLLEHGANINIIEPKGPKSLHSASRSHCDVVEFLLQHGANVDIEEAETCWTPLHFAAQNGELEICRRLLKHGADIDKTDEDQETPLHVASRSGNVEIARFFRARRQYHVQK